MTGDGIARVRGGGELLVRGVICTRESRDGRGARLIMHTTQKSCQAISTLSTLTSEKCRYSGRKIYPGRKIWSLICPIPDASVQALEQVKEVGEFFSSMPPLQNSVTSFSFKSSYTSLDMWMWDCESVRETAGSPPICQILGASNPHWVSDPRLSDFYPRHVHGAFIDIRSLSQDHGRLHTHPLLHCTPHTPTMGSSWWEFQRGGEGGLSLLRNFLWAKHRAVLWLHMFWARNTGTSAIEWWNVGRTGNNSGIRTGQSR